MKLNLKAISEVLSAVRDYLFPYEKISKKFSKINNERDLTNFIKEKSAFVTQSTLYGYLKTRMGLKQNMMFTDDVFVDSVNKAKWNIFSEAVTDLTFYSVSFLNTKYNIDSLDPNKMYDTILENEIITGLPKDMCEKYKSKFKEKLNSFNIKEYSNNNPFTNSCNALFHWAPIADELKELDKEIVINSIKNKWMLVVADLEKIPVNLK
ncbi:esterase [Pelagibacteraceae bacterium]|nr:esterase [Pelagibacteraceae bacterium]